MSLNYITDRLAYSNDAQAIVALATGHEEIFRTPDNPVTFGKHKVAPWGKDNDLPTKVMEKIRGNDIVAPNVLFNVQAGYGQGIKPMTRIVENGRVVEYVECIDEDVLEFFDNNDVSGWFLEQLSDMVTFFNVFPEIILSKDGRQITGLRHLEAVYSRWGCMTERDTEISRLYYAEWENGRPRKDKWSEVPVLSRYDTCRQLQNKMQGGRGDRAFALQVNMPTPGRTYYSYPYWWSIFKSGWYDLSAMLPAFKKALIKNHLAVRYVVYISDEFWKDLVRRNNIAPTDVSAVEALKKTEIERIMNFLMGEEAKGGGLISTKKLIPGAGGKPIEDKYIQIEPIPSEIKGGEFIEDAEEASNMISYAMGVHPNLNGATPGKSKGSLGGSDKRELYNIKSSLMSPFRNRLLIPLNLIKRYNGWPANTVFTVPEHVFTTLDKNKSGSETNTSKP